MYLQCKPWIFLLISNIIFINTLLIRLCICIIFFITSIIIINWNTIQPQPRIYLIDACQLLLHFFFLTSTFFWTLCAICVAPIKISSSFMGLIRSATCKFEKNWLVIKIHHKLKFLHTCTYNVNSIPSIVW